MTTIITILLIMCGAMLATAAVFAPFKNKGAWKYLDMFSLILILLPVAVTKAVNKVKQKIGM